MSFYYRKKVKVPFEPRSDLLAVSLKGKRPEEPEQGLLAAVADINLRPLEVSRPILEGNVRVFQLPEEIGEQEKTRLEERLSEQPMVRYAGPVVHLNDRGISFMTNEFVIKYKQRIGREEVNEMVKPYNLEVVRKLPYAANAFVLRANGPASYELLDGINELAQSEQVEYAEPNLVSTAVQGFTPNDFLFTSQPHHPIINTEEAWDITRGDQDIIIAVVDNGCDIDHPDFINDPAAGWDKVYEPFDFMNMDDDPINNDPTDPNRSHGTKSCGIAAANANNSEGVAGVAPGCRLMPIRWSSGTMTDWADLYRWVAGFDDPESTDPDFPERISPGADVISNSIGVLDNPISSVMEDAFDYIADHGRAGKGCVVVFCALNENRDIATYDYTQWAAYDKTIAVASSAISPPDASEVKVNRSDFGAAIDVCAPGGGRTADGEARTISTTNVGDGDTAGSASATSNDYGSFGQTSCACPQVAGTAALMLSVNPDLTWQEVRQILRDTAERIDAANTDPVGQWVDTDGDGVPDFSQWYGYGRIDAERAVRAAAWSVELQTPTLNFNNVPEGEETVRAAVFSVRSCLETTFEIVSGPTVISGPSGTDFDTPLGDTVTLEASTDCSTPRQARLWISYTGTDSGDEAEGTVSIRCRETGQTWDIRIAANTVRRTTTAAVLVLDKSNSMNFDAGDGRRRIDVLRDSAPVFVDLMREDDAIGIVSFDHDAYDVMPVTAAGPLEDGDGRRTAKSLIADHTPNPAGSTSIGDGIELAHSYLALPSVADYDKKVMVVLTDGRENRPEYIADVADSIDEFVYGIGLGTAEQINPAALEALTNDTGGYLLMSGTLDDHDYFRLQKYYLQIFAGVNNEEIVLDPEGWLKPGQVHRIPFRLTDADISSDVILLSPAPQFIRFLLETPNGKIIDPNFASGSPVVSYVSSSDVSYYRIKFPVPVDGSEAYAGTWHAILSIPQVGPKESPSHLEDGLPAVATAQVHGLRYSLNVHTYSNLRMRASLSQNSHEPGADLTLRAVLTEYGLPLEKPTTVRAELERPDKTASTLTLAPVQPGVFETKIAASMPGIYRLRTVGSGNTISGQTFNREQLLSGAVWKGGDEPLPTSQGDTTACCRQTVLLLRIGLALLTVIALMLLWILISLALM